MRYWKNENQTADQNSYGSFNPHSGSEDCCQYLSADSVRRMGTWI